MAFTIDCCDSMTASQRTPPLVHIGSAARSVEIACRKSGRCEFCKGSETKKQWRGLRVARPSAGHSVMSEKATRTGASSPRAAQLNALRSDDIRPAVQL